MADEPEARRHHAEALYREGVTAFRKGDRAASLAHNEEALRIGEELGDSSVQAVALVGLSRVALRDGDFSLVRSLATRALQLVRDRPAAERVMPLHLLAAGTRMSGAYDAARDLYVESLELNRSLGDERMVAVEFHNLGHVNLHLDRLADAIDAFRERSALVRGGDSYDVAMTSLNEAALALARGHRDRAPAMLERCTEILDEAGIVLDPDDAFEVAWLRQRLGHSPPA